MSGCYVWFVGCGRRGLVFFICSCGLEAVVGL